MTVASMQPLEPKVLERPEHRLSRRKVSHHAVKVLYRLHRAGYLAYLVGGSVRDILLDREPKDFDVATNARPEEVRSLFRNSRIIGRRFRLVHVLFRDEIVEVSTFRASPEPPEVPDAWEDEAEEAREDEAEARTVGIGGDDASLYGTPMEDAWRRDFTVNALFYNIADFSILDWVGGLADLDARVLRVIGDPSLRFEEDPVRMMRALEYRERLGFEIEPATEAALRASAELIVEAAPARLSYELFETLRSGFARGICSAWREAGILMSAFPELATTGRQLDPILTEIDRLAAAGERLDDASLVGALLLPRYGPVERDLVKAGQRLDNVALLARIRELMEPVGTRMHLANHSLHLIHQGLFTLSKLRRPPDRGRQVVKLTRQAYFPVAWALRRIGVAAGVLDREGFEAWARAVEQVRRLGPGEEPSLEREPEGRTRKRRRPRRRRRTS